jgi:hypothetical protein
VKRESNDETSSLACCADALVAAAAMAIASNAVFIFPPLPQAAQHDSHTVTD